MPSEEQELFDTLRPACVTECAELSAMHFPRYMEAWSAYIQAGEQELLPWMRQMLVYGER